MQIFATFEYSTYVEIAVSELEIRGIRDIYAVPLDLQREEARIIDTMHRSDGISFLDKGFIFAYIFATIGATKGFVWGGGPIIWGIAGGAFGFVLGVAFNIVKYAITRRKKELKVRKGKKGEVILIITCKEEQQSLVKEILWDHRALGLAVTK